MLLILLLLCSKKNILLHLYDCKKKLLEKIIFEKSRLVVFLLQLELCHLFYILEFHG